MKILDKNLKVGFTGTRTGMTSEQEKTFSKLIKKLNPSEFRHGDCIGSDLQAHVVVKKLGVRIVVHPPLNSMKRALAPDPDEVLPKREYLERNRDIVDASDILIATPESRMGVQRSGTWATVRYAMREKKPVILIFPDGVVERREGDYAL